MFRQVYDPVNNSYAWSTIFAVLPLLTVFVLLGVVKLRAQWAALLGLAVAIIVAVAVYSMPVGQALDAGLEGRGLRPVSDHVDRRQRDLDLHDDRHDRALRRATRSFGTVSEDQRVQAIIIAFCFGALLEALAGFGTPVAITSVMLVALGFSKLKAAAVRWSPTPPPSRSARSPYRSSPSLRPPADPYRDLASIVGRQTPCWRSSYRSPWCSWWTAPEGCARPGPLLCSPGVGVRDLAVSCSNYISIALTDVVASLGSAVAIVAFLRVWQPPEVLRGESLTEEEIQSHLSSARDVGARSRAGQPPRGDASAVPPGRLPARTPPTPLRTTPAWTSPRRTRRI